MKNTYLFGAALTGVILLSQGSWAWGKRGHQIVGETAAITVSGEPNAAFMRTYSFDFAYYANVPDVIWKRPATYESEKPEHFMDLEIFHKEFSAKQESTKVFTLSRSDFEAKFPELKRDAGRAYWRIQEMAEQLAKVTAQLKSLKEEKGKERQSLQETWLLVAGPMAHYVGDLAMPLHISENYDGQLTDQRGIHHYFEEDMVDQLYPELSVKVLRKVKAEWPKFKRANDKKTVLQLLEQETAGSHKDIAALLKLDKGHTRSGDLKDAKRYEAIIVRRLADASLTLAEIYRRNLGWKFDDNRFYFFSGEPKHLKPGGGE